MSSQKTLRILHLYPDEMNIYGDWGNILTISRRCEWHGITPEIVLHHPNKTFPTDADIILGGGGQDSGQNVVKDDLLLIGDAIHTLADANVPMLMICGMYQLFGRFFKTNEGLMIPGICLFDMETHAGPTRLIGNVVCDSPFGKLIGYENHSGLTMLDDTQRALGTIVSGAGNNGIDKTEGAIYKNVYGSYLHGSLLPKNPVFADGLIEAAMYRKYGSFEPQVIDDRFADKARKRAEKRSR